MSWHGLLQALDDSAIGSSIRESSLLFPSIETIHVLMATTVVGTIAIVDLRLIGYGAHRRGARRLITELLPFTWVALNGRDTLLLILLGVTAMIAHICINRALKLAPASKVVPYQYSTIFWAVILGYIFFNDIPGWGMLLGAGVIIAAGIYIFIHEQAVAKTVATADLP